MPVRPRRRRRVTDLGLREAVDLTIGPTADSLPFDRLHRLYDEWAIYFDSESWGFKFFEQGVDDREPEAVGDLGCPGLPKPAHERHD